MTKLSLRRIPVLAALLAALSAAHPAAAQTVIPQAGWTLQSVDSQETSAGDYGADNAFDGNGSTMWHTQWSSGSPGAPHEIVINLGASYAVAGFRYQPRNDGNPNGRIGGYEFYVSTDGSSWGAAVASGTFANTGSEQQVSFTAKTGRYVRLRALSEVNGQPWTAVAELNVLSSGGAAGGGSGGGSAGGAGAISQAAWTLRSVDSQETSAGDYRGANAFDGDPSTMWHTAWSSGLASPPHDIQINLGASYSVSGFRYLARTDGNANGRIGSYEFYVSSDGTSWGTAVASGTFANTGAEQQVNFTAKTGRYIRLRAVTEVNGQAYTAVAELNVLSGSSSPSAPANQPPTGSITAPASNVTITAGQSVSFSGSGTDSDNNLPFSYAWSFGSGGPGASSLQNPGAIVFPNPGVYTVTLTVSDAAGGVDGTPATRTITVQSAGGGGGGGAASSAIPQSNWSLLSVDSQETVAADARAVRAFDGNPSTMWHTQWAGGSPPAPHDLQINLGGSYSVTGFRYQPRTDGNENGRIAGYQFYVSSDGVSWGTAVATGTFPDSGSEQQVTFTAKTGRYVRLRAMSEVNGNPWTSVAELNVLGTANGSSGNQLPSVSVSATPNPANGSVSLSAAAFDTDGSISKVEFYRGSSLIATDTTSPYSATASSLPFGIYVFMAVAQDNTGDRTASASVSVTLGSAQSPSRLLFTPSPDHDSLVQEYVLEIFRASDNPTSATPLASVGIGRPSVVNGECAVDISDILAGIGAGSYKATVSASGPGGASRSSASSSFTLP